MKEGWLLDLYPGKPGEMVVWLKTKQEKAVRLVDSWLPHLYVAANDKSDLEYLAQRREIQPYIRESCFEEKFEKIIDAERSQVLKLVVSDAKKVEELAKIIDSMAAFGVYRIYNADIKPEQSYLYEKNIFPLCLADVKQTNGNLQWILKDDVRSIDYQIPPLKMTHLLVQVDKTESIAKPNDPIKQIIIDEDAEHIHIDEGSEEDKLLKLAETIRCLNPDILFTEDGDTFTLPYLAARAQTHNVELTLGRDLAPIRTSPRAGASYFSYGKILFKPASARLRGRIHIDKSNTFVMDCTGLIGLYEVSRVCRIPIHAASRASIGKCMSSLQFYYAHQKDILVPWKPALSEHFKTRLELLMADRGGFVFEPIMGVYEDVAELDFTSLYPNIMIKKNISCETVKCSCCLNSSSRVPELNWNVCQKRIGITPTTLEILASKRRVYKLLRRTIPSEKELYEARQVALKWILVCCFGYLGFNNAKFGRIDAHISVCAWARRILLESVRIAERHGFRILHGIVDALWFNKEKADVEDYLQLAEEITRETGFTIEFEGVYKWIAFPPSKVYRNIPVVNRYFGVLKDGSVKIRGLDSRRSDTPVFLSRCQIELIKLLSKADNIKEVKNLIPECKDMFRRHALLLFHRAVSAKELIVNRRISKEYHEYENLTLEAIAAKQLMKEGLMLRAGQTIRYLITDYYSKQADRRVLVEQLTDEDTAYDTKRYVELLAEAYASVLQPFGCSKTDLINTSTTAEKPLLA